MLSAINSDFNLTDRLSIDTASSVGADVKSIIKFRVMERTRPGWFFSYRNSMVSTSGLSPATAQL